VNISASDRMITDFYERRKNITAQNVSHEMAVRESFKHLLEDAGKRQGWTLVVEQKVEGLKNVVRPDGTLRDANTLPRGYWEAKDTRDDLEAEIQKKFARGYPKSNIIFEDTLRAILYQSGQQAGTYDLNNAAEVAILLTQFLNYTQPNIAGFEQSVNIFKERTPELAKGLLALIQQAHKSNRPFQQAFETFYEVCKTALNPNLSRDAVDEMLIQHLLTERLMRTVFDNPDFTRRNVIAAEVEKVIDALTRMSFNRKEFLGQLDFFYEAIERAARDLTGFRERQTFINTVYERFFQGFAVKVADTHGIVYTPQPIVDFMCAAVEEVLRDEFGLALHDEQVCIIDPATGTGNFVLNLLRRIHNQNPAKLPEVYRDRLFANEVMLLPYYVASLNIEHTYYELTGQYEPFEGLCFVDTLDLAEGAQMRLGFVTEANSERVERQKKAPITVIIGNPPYNVGQLDENDNNKKRKYAVVDQRVRETYAKDSAATNKNALDDMYVKFFRWAADRLGDRDGVICYITNNNFADAISFDGMRKHLLQDFTRVYHLDLHGNVRQNPKLSGTTHNVFGIQVGVGITVAVRSSQHADRKLFYHRVPEFWTAAEKLAYLEEMVEVKGRHNSLNTVEWQAVIPNARHTWLIAENADEYAALIPIGSKAAKSAKASDVEAIFKIFSNGVKTNRDTTVYDFDQDELLRTIQDQIEAYNAEVDRYKRANRPSDVDSFVRYDRVNWSRDLKLDLVRGNYAEYDQNKVRNSLYRPFTKQYLFFDRILNEEVYVFPRIFPTEVTEAENKIICIGGYGRKPFAVTMTNHIPDLNFYADPAQCFPFYVYDEDGSNRRENITDWALAQFRGKYADDAITRWDIFYYVYGLLHSPEYRERYAASLKRDLPRIPFASTVEDFRAFATAGQALAKLHLEYESLEPYRLDFQWKPGARLNYAIKDKMHITEKTPESFAVKVNDVLTLRGIPTAVQGYKLGSRSALDWVIDQYQVKTDKRSGIISDPNQYSEDEQYIVRLVGQVVRVSLETVAIVESLPSLGLGAGEAGDASS
jgi:predicted helicase